MSGAASQRTPRSGLIGRAPAMLELDAMIERVATTESTVLIQGENGTGKELVARAIHQQSKRGGERFVVANCSALNDNLLDSELFGHKRGAFTGAVADQIGLFEAAHGGTFFLDEIGDMSPALQVKILRALQEGTFSRVGDPAVYSVDVRIIAATNRDLAAMVAAGSFREDLFYRINVVSVALAPLRERISDLPLLVDWFVARHNNAARPKTLSPTCLQRMLEYPWPGNVRELENEIERLIVLVGDSSTIPESLLSPRIRSHTAAPPIDGYSLPAAIEALERRMIGDAMHRHGGNKTRAAAELRISRRNLIRLVSKYELE